MYERLKEQIISGKYQANSSLRQDALAKEFGTSRIPVREALFMLEGDGLVDFKAHKGAVVRPLSRKEAAELFHLRAILEGDLLRQAIPNMTTDDLIQAEKALVDYDNAVASGKNIAKWSKLNWAFHHAVYNPSNSPISMSIIQSLHDNTDRYQRIRMTLSGAVPRAHDEHIKILDACKSRQPDEAVRLMQQHILEASRQVTEFLEASC